MQTYTVTFIQQIREGDKEEVFCDINIKALITVMLPGLLKLIKHYKLPIKAVLL